MLLHIFGLYISLTFPAFPKNLNIGAVSTRFTPTGRIDYQALQNIAAIVMAVHDINNQTLILPRTNVRLAMTFPPEQFLGTMKEVENLILTAFGGNSISGIIGSGGDTSSKAIGQTVAGISPAIEQISYGSRAAELAEHLYPYTIRTCVQEATGGYAVASFVAYMGWSHVSVFVSSNQYGSYTSIIFTNRAAQLGITIDSQYMVWPGTMDFTDTLSTISKSGDRLKIFILFMVTEDVGRLLEQGFAVGLFHEGTQIIGTEKLSNVTALMTVMSPSANKGKILKGMISLVPEINRTSSKYSNFVKRWRAQKPTFKRDSKGNIVCDTTTDQNGQYLYQGHPDGNTSKPFVCAGLNFSAFHTDGLDITENALNAYDATWALAYGLDILLNTVHAHNFTTDMLQKVLVENVSFSGVSGHVSFDSKGYGLEKYAYGDREEGIRYKVLNFNPLSAIGYQQVFIWTPETGVYICPLSVNGCSHYVVYNTADNSRPTDKVPVIEIQMNSQFKIVILVLTCFVMLFILWFWSVMFFWRKNAIVKVTQPGMMYLVLCGITMGCMKAAIAAFDITDIGCILGIWFGHLSYMLVFTALILKVWRVNAIVQAGLKKVKVTMKSLMKGLAVILFIYCLYLTAYTIVANPRVAYDEIFDGKKYIHRMKYGLNPAATVMRDILFAFEGLVLVYGANECYNAKKAPSAVNDAHLVSLSIYVIVFVCALIFPIVFISIDPTPENLGFIMAIGFIIACFFIGNILFLYKIHLIIQKAEVNEKFEVVQSSENSVSYNPIKTIRKALNSHRSQSSKVDESHRKHIETTSTHRDKRIALISEGRDMKASDAHDEPGPRLSISSKQHSTLKKHHVRYSERMEMNSVNDGDVKSVHIPHHTSSPVTGIPEIAEEKPLFLANGTIKSS